MSASINYIADALYKAMSESDNKKTKPYDTPAEVRRIDGDTAYVHIPGGIDETPAQITTNAKPGDKVMVRVANGRAWLLGNSTNPPTDDTLAIAANDTAVSSYKVAGIAIENANAAIDGANEAKASANEAREAANSAKDDAKTANEAAQQAIGDAQAANQAATEAKEDARLANQAAEGAVEDARIANSAADRAIGDAQAAHDAADAAQESANQAKNDAKAAHDAADAAQADATKANDAANGAVTSLGIVQGVVDDLGKDMDDMQTHVAMMDAVVDPDTGKVLVPAGLHIVPTNSGYFVVVSNDGMYVYDNHSSLVATFGENIKFDSIRPQKIGGDNAYVEYYDSNNDGEADSIRIVGANISSSTGDVKDIQDALDDYKESNDARVSNVEDAVGTNAEDLTNYITSNNEALKEIEKQIDGAIDTWYYAGDPTTSNEPAMNWTTNAQKEAHLRDLYFNTTNGHTFRWAKDGNTYKWIQIEDADAIKALSDAKNAQDTADGKRRVFVTTPKPPYDVGDLWTGGSTGDIKRCKTPKTSTQTFAEADWELASKYTDDSALNSFKTTYNTDLEQTNQAIALRATKTEAQGYANDAENNAKSYSDNSIVTAKAEIKVTTDAITSEVSKKVGDSEVISKINQSAEEIKISAEKIQLEGAAIFNSYAKKSETVSDVAIEYAVGNNATTAPSSGWSSNTPTWTEGKYIWQRTTKTINGSTNITYACIQGAKGKDGTNGTDGTDGKDGKDGISPTVSKTGDTVTIVDANGNKVYVSDGKDGTNGTNGQDGTSYYTYIRYSANSNGSSMTTSPQSNTKYIGLYTGTSSTVPTYTAFTWSKYVGDPGTNGTNGKDGKDGTSVTVTKTEYQSGTSATSAPTGTWQTSPPTVSQGNYLWTKTTYSDGNYSYSVARQGVNGTNGTNGTNGAPGAKGDKGDQGYSVSEVKILYYLKSNTTAPSKPTSAVTRTDTGTGYWTTAVPTYVSGYSYFVCAQTKLTSGSYIWSDPTLDNGLTESNKQAADAVAKVNSAAYEEQYIYISKAAGTSSISSGPTTWVTRTDDVQNTWTAKRPLYNTNYPVVFVAKQRRTVAQSYGTTCTCTTPTKDDTVTVIDGGHITTGTIDASKVTVTNIDAGQITTGKLGASHIDASSITIGASQVSDLDDTLGDYATKDELTAETNARRANYATSNTGSSTTTKNATCTNFALYTGATVTVKFDYVNTYSTPSLNVNNTGAKVIKSYTGAALTEAEYKWAAGAAITFVYDGSYWRMQDSGATASKAAAAASASEASGYASSASGSASSASGYATNASNSASSASGYATNASNSASAASDKATAASNSATAASNSASAASGYATNASNSATAASNSASSASGYATNASNSASAAAGSATEATNQANAAKEAVDWTMGIMVTAINYSANTATLQATVYKGGVVQTSGFTLQWYKGSSKISGATSATLSVTDLNTSYTCIAS